VAIEASFIPLAQEIPLDLAHESVVNILPVQSDMFLFKGAQQTNLTPAKGFEFTQRKFSVVAVVELPDGTIGSRDPFRQSEPYGQQVALVPLWGETEVPTGAKVVGAVELAGFAISAQDRETGQEYKLGYLPCERDFQGA
jgi:hypothetical protein